jgi:hypothetical protein
MLCLDFFIFGNGNDLAQPYLSGRFYWLVDTDPNHRRTGAFYTFCGGLGAQLESALRWDAVLSEIAERDHEKAGGG